MALAVPHTISFKPSPPLHVTLATQSRLSLPSVRDIIGPPTPIIHLPKLSLLSGRPCYAKQDYLQPSGAFKGRGAAAAIAQIVKEARQKGLPLPTFIAASAGNHGAGVSAAARHFGAEAIIFVPHTAPRSKINLIESFGAKVVLIEGKIEDVLAAAFQVSDGIRNVFIHPFDNTVVAAGQGTLALELIEQVPPETLRDATFFIQVGGGGLIAGNASVLKATYPNCKIIAVTDENVPALGLGLICGRKVKSIPVTDADGTRVGEIGDTALRNRLLYDGLCIVTPAQLARAMDRFKKAFGHQIEGAGALGLAACHIIAGQRIEEGFNTPNSAAICIISGRNVDDSTFETVTQKTLEPDQEHRHAFVLEFPERPSMLKKILDISRHTNIIALHYQQANDRATARVEIEYESPDHIAIAALQATLIEAGIMTTALKRHHHQLQRIPLVATDSIIPRLIEVENQSGAFLDFVSSLKNEDVIFLRYRAGAHKNHCGQVWMASVAST